MQEPGACNIFFSDFSVFRVEWSKTHDEVFSTCCKVGRMVRFSNHTDTTRLQSNQNQLRMEGEHTTAPNYNELFETKIQPKRFLYIRDIMERGYMLIEVHRGFCLLPLCTET